MTFKELQQQAAEKVAHINAFWDAHPDDNLTGEETDQIKGLNAEYEELSKQAADMREAQEMRTAARKTAEEMNRPRRTFGFPEGETGEKGLAPSAEYAAARRELQTLGQQFVASEEFKNWLRAVAPNGAVNEKMRLGDSPGVGFKTLVTGVSDTSGGAVVRTDYRGLVDYPFRMLGLRDIITNGNTESDLIEYPRVTGYTNNAAPVAEATATSGSSGAKPESGLALEKVTTAVKTIAHWIPATKRALADAGQVRTLIDSFLRFGLEEELEDQMLNGDGTGENFVGLANTSGLTTQAYSNSLLETTRKARTAARITGRTRATAYLMNPTDWESLDLQLDGNGGYYFGGPQALGNPRLWGLPVIESEFVTQGVAYVGDFRQMVIWDREQATIRATDSHSDFFIRNMVAILGEMRAAFGVLRPGAIVSIDLTA